MYRRFVDNGKLAVLTSARRENGFPPKCKTSTGNKFDFRSPSPSQKSALLKVPICGRRWRNDEYENKVYIVCENVLFDLLQFNTRNILHLL